jgi:ABC-type glycerol-3-phosphate transport system substrate-binding protein
VGAKPFHPFERAVLLLLLAALAVIAVLSGVWMKPDAKAKDSSPHVTVVMPAAPEPPSPLHKARLLPI